MKKLLASLFASFVFPLWAQVGSTCPSLVITGHPAYPPVAWASHGKIIGAGPDLVASIATQLGVSQVDSKDFGSWESAQRAARNGQADVIFGIYKNDERAAYLNFVDPPFMLDPVVVVVRKGEGLPVRKWEDLKGRRGVTNAGESFGNRFDAFMEKDLTVARAQGVERAFEALMSKRADYLIIGLYPGRNEARRLGLSTKVDFLPGELVAAEMYVAFSKKSRCYEALGSGFAARLKRAVQQGRVQQLLGSAEKHLKQEDLQMIDQLYQFQYEDTRELIRLVQDATERVRTKGEAAFGDFRVSGSRWREEENYVFVLDPQGNMLVHPDPALEGKGQLDLKDINGKPIIRGLIAVTALPGKPEGWYHYQWPVPGGLLPRWKSSYVRRVTAPSGKDYIVGSGIYNDRMERPFVVDAVQNAVGQIEKHGAAAFPLFHDPAGPFLAKDAYIFVYDPNGINLVNPAFPNLEGRSFLGWKDTQGKRVLRGMFDVLQTGDSGWVDYLWPKPGESVSTQKSAYVTKARVGDQWVLVGSGVYLADAPAAMPAARKMTAPELMALVRDGAGIFEKHGEQAYAEFRKQGSRWFRDDTYFFVWTLDGTRVFHAADPAGEGQNLSDAKDIVGRPWGRMILDAVRSASGEGWVHYLYPEPGNIFPTWKSTFLKRVTFPSGKQYIVGSGIYNMRMDEAFIEDVVDRAATLIAERGKDAFGDLRDRTGPFVFMDTYVFVSGTDGTEWVNPVFPSLEGRNLIDLRDLHGKAVIRDEIAAAMKEGSAWLDMYWFKPGQNTPALKRTFVRKVQSGGVTYIVGSGLYVEE